MNVTFSQHLAELMKSKGISNSELARRIGVSHVAVGNYLNGRVPKFEVAVKIAEVFEVTPDYLLNPGKHSTPYGRIKESLSASDGDKISKAILGRYADLMGRSQEMNDPMLRTLAESTLHFETAMMAELRTAREKIANLRVKLGDLIKEL